MCRIASTFFVAAACALIAESLNAQQVSLRGIVIDQSTGAAISGASIEVITRKAVAITDSLGQFALSKLPTGAAMLKVRQLGYDDAIFS